MENFARTTRARLALPFRAFTALDQEQNPAAPAVKREAEEDWGKEKGR